MSDQDQQTVEDATTDPSESEAAGTSTGASTAAAEDAAASAEGHPTEPEADGPASSAEGHPTESEADGPTSSAEGAPAAPEEGGDSAAPSAEGLPSSPEQGALAAAIEENPEAVARFVEHLDAVNDLLDVLDLGMDAMDDEMVESLARTGGTLAESADGLATRETVALAESVGENGGELADAMETVVALQRSGTLDDLAAMADLVSLAAGAMDDEMVETLAARGTALGELADTAAEPETVRGLETMLQAVGDAADEQSEPVGVVGALRATRDPEVKTGLGFLLGLAKAIGANAPDAGAEG